MDPRKGRLAFSIDAILTEEEEDHRLLNWSNGLNFWPLLPPLAHFGIVSTFRPFRPIFGPKFEPPMGLMDHLHDSSRSPDNEFLCDENTKNALYSCNKSTCSRRAGHPYRNRTPAVGKKPRTSFTKEQITVLERRFAEQKYLASSERAPLALQLCMEDAQVKTWFQNRRTKWRRQEAEEREFANKLLLRQQQKTK